MTEDRVKMVERERKAYQISNIERIYRIERRETHF